MTAISLRALGGALLLAALTSVSVAQDQSKGQKQLNGINGTFGTVYTLANSANVAIHSAAYTLNPANCYEIMLADRDSKLLVIGFSIKNATPQDIFVNPSDWFVVVDDKQNVYQPSSAWQESMARKVSTWTLRPSQGVGQPALKDPVHMAFKIPNAVRVDKIMINLGRLGHASEEVIRFPLSAPPKTEAEKQTVKNFATPLPEECRDTKDAFGAVRLDEGKATLAAPFPSGYFNMQLDSIAAAPDAVIDGNPAEDGKQFWVATFTVDSMVDADLSMFDVVGDEGNFTLSNEDGDTYGALNFRKKSADEAPEKAFKKIGDKYSFRVFFQLGKSTKPTHISFGTNSAPKWGLDIASK